MRLGGGVHAVGLVENFGQRPVREGRRTRRGLQTESQNGGFLAVAEPPDVIRKEQVVVFPEVGRASENDAQRVQQTMLDRIGDIVRQLIAGQL